MTQVHPCSHLLEAGPRVPCGCSCLSSALSLAASSKQPHGQPWDGAVLQLDSPRPAAPTVGLTIQHQHWPFLNRRNKLSLQYPPQHNTQNIVRACSVTSVVSDSLWPHGLWPARLLCPWDSPGKNTGDSCHFFLQGIFLTQRSNLCFLPYQVYSSPLSHLGSPNNNNRHSKYATRVQGKTFPLSAKSGKFSQSHSSRFRLNVTKRCVWPGKWGC